jgi:hypothetical protein
MPLVGTGDAGYADAARGNQGAEETVADAILLESAVRTNGVTVAVL